MLEADNNYNTKVSYDDGSTINVFSNQLHNRGLDHWQGWQCQAGASRLYIDNQGNVYSCQSMNQTLGNLNSTWQLHANGETCTKKTCSGCTDDLMIEKHEK